MYYIYHIPGVKIGCTKRLERRLHEQKFKISDCDRIITTGCIKKASEIEKELQINYGYKVDAINYEKMFEISKKGKRDNLSSEDRKRGGMNNKGKKHYGENLQKIRNNFKKACESAIKVTSTPIIAYDKSGNYIGEFSSTHDAQRKLGVWQQNICHVLKGKIKQTGGYTFKYKIC